MNLKVSEVFLGFENKIFEISSKNLANRGIVYKAELIIAKLSLIKEKNYFYLNGNLETTVEYTCVRCLKKNPSKINIPVNISIFEETMKNQTINEHEIIYFSKSNDYVNLKNIFSDLIALAEPIQPLCDKKCKGLCPSCGIKKTYSCNCNKSTVTDTWDKLKDLHI